MKYIVSLLTFIVLVIAACGGGGSAALNPPVTLKLASFETEHHPLTIGLLELSRLAALRTHDTLTIQVFHSGQLGEEKLVLEKVKNGEIDMACLSATTLSSISKSFTVLELPFLFADDNHFARVFEGNLGEELMNGLAKAEIVGLAFFDPGALHFYSGRKELKSLSDFKGMKIRIPQGTLTRRFIEKLGGFPAPMQADQIYTALKTGVIDAGENSLPQYVEGNYAEYAKYFTYLPHSRIPALLVMSKKAREKLPPPVWDILTSSARDAVKSEKSGLAKYENDAIAKMEKNGITVTRITDAKEFQQVADALSAEQDDDVKRMIEKIKAAR
jgi:tripartite ATP-independent transporter DctP family solute receptor